MLHSLIFFIIALTVLVVIHEWGHYRVARLCGVKVLRFSIGFGKPLWRRLGKNGTEFVVAALPLGGYVKMLDERETEVAPKDQSQAFNRQSLSKRNAIIAAGPAANFIFAILAYWLILVIGVPGLKPVIADITNDSPASVAGILPGDEIIEVSNQKTPTWQTVYRQLLLSSPGAESIDLTLTRDGLQQQVSIQLPEKLDEQQSDIMTLLGVQPRRPTLPAMLSEIEPESPAARAGLQSGDQLISADGEKLDDWQSWVSLIQSHAGETMSVRYQREDEIYRTELTPMATDNGQGRIGAGVDTRSASLPASMQSELKYGPLAAIPAAVGQTWQFSAATAKSLWGMLTGTVSTKNLGGPVSIAQFAGSSASQGMVAFLSFLAMISISLGILNLLPVPVLDGGHLLMNTIEWVKGEPLSEITQQRFTQIGMLFVLTLMFFALWNDLLRAVGQ